MSNERYRFLGKGLAALACVIGGAVAAQGVQLAMLDRLAPGLWEVRMREGGQADRICLDNGRRLIQLRHPNLTCRQFVIEDGPSAVTVHYTCPGQGSGRTHLRFETPRLVQIESSGLSARLPFDFAAEARRVGDCSAS
ncbi:MAG: hypothetical protein Q8R44_14275 [Novosphingobium sp.]|nr:hypothetical protein [Novosphingobium sp.]